MANSLAEALFEVQGSVPDLQKNAINPHFGNSYISLDSLVEQVLPVLRESEILFMQPLSAVGPEPAIVTRFVHVPTGETAEWTSPLVLGKVGPQDWGSSITYARRYALLTALGLVADADDDAEKATSRGKRVEVEIRGKDTRKSADKLADKW